MRKAIFLLLLPPLFFLVFLGFSFYSRGELGMLIAGFRRSLDAGDKEMRTVVLSQTNKSSPVPTIIQPTPISLDFGLIIPKINVNAPVRDVDGFNEKQYLPSILQGIGHFQRQVVFSNFVEAAYPGEAGNVFLFGHSQIPGGDLSHYKGVFNNLAQLENGDSITVFYQGKAYDYEVYEKRVVEKTALEYLAKTEEETLTLMTCWPLGLDVKRLIVRAKRLH